MASSLIISIIMQGEYFGGGRVMIGEGIKDVCLGSRQLPLAVLRPDNSLFGVEGVGVEAERVRV